MFSHLSAFTALALPLLAVATPIDSVAGSCTTGPIQCCESTQTAGSPAAATLLGLLGVVVQDLNVLVGLTCSPISVIGVGTGNSCSASPVCCTDNSNSLISIGCVPVTL